MNTFRQNPFADHLEVVATIRDRAIEASIAELRHQDELTLALREMIRNGVDINDLSDAAGLPVDAIQKRIDRELHFGEDLASLTGMR